MCKICAQGEQNFRHKFRVLCAGAGTGDAPLSLAEQLNNTDAEIVYLDFSLASMRIAQKRAAMRGLANIVWFHDSLGTSTSSSSYTFTMSYFQMNPDAMIKECYPENLPQLGLGKFDLISCSGMLHHLPDPQAGLNTLAASLKPGGGMAIMVYPQVFRTAIYQVINQEKDL